MSSYWRDEDFQSRLLIAYCRDRNFLKKMSGLLKVEHFKPRKGEGMEEAFVIAQLASKYWHDYREPIGGMLKTEVLDYISKNKRKLGNKLRERLLSLSEKIRKSELVAIEAIEKKVIDYLQHEAKIHAIKELISIQEKEGEISDHKFKRICNEALKSFDNNLKASDYSNEDEIKKRIRRREKNRDRKYPYLLIDALDKEVRTIPRGEVGIVLGKYKLGKSTCLVHISQAYALQGYNVLYLTLEDSLDMVEDRFDASFTGIKMKRLFDKSSLLKRKLRKKMQRVRGRIKIVDGTDGGMSIQRIEEIWENYRNQGFAADLVVVDYDEGVSPPQNYSGDSGERRQMKDIYKEYKSFISRRDLYGWIGAQTKRGKTGVPKRIVTGDDSAEDISKIRRCAMVIGVGDGPEEWGLDGRTIGVPVHRYDRGGKYWSIMGDFERAIFYSRELTEEAKRTNKHKHDED